MKEITAQLECYHDALIMMWNQALSLTKGEILNWDVMDALDDAGCDLFTAIVSIPVGLPEMKKSPSYESVKMPCGNIVVHATSFDKGCVVSNDRRNYTLIPNDSFQTTDDFLFLDLFDFDVCKNRLFEYVSVVSTEKGSCGNQLIFPFSSCQFFLVENRVASKAEMNKIQ